MVTSRRRRTAVAVAATLLLVVIGGVAVMLRQDRMATRADTAALHEQRLAADASADRIRAHAGALGGDRARVAAELRAAIEVVRALDAAEADELARLEDRRQERAVTRSALEGAVVALGEATQQSTTNAELIAALDRCLDGVTRAGNALSVGDVLRGLAALGRVAGACDRVGAVVGP